MEPLTILLLSLAAFTTNFFSVITGGAGLVLTPLLITAGISPLGAIALAKFSNAGSAISGTIRFHREKQIDYRLALPLVVFAIAGALIGTYSAFRVDAASLEHMIAFLILGTLIVMLLNRQLGESEQPVELTPGRMAVGGILVLIAVAVGTIAGGLIIMLSYILVLLFGESFLHSAGTQKILNDVVFLTATIIFMLQGAIDYYLGVPMLVAASMGGWFGSRYGMDRGTHWVKNAFMAAIIILSAHLVMF